MYSKEPNGRDKTARMCLMFIAVILSASPLFSQDAPAKVELFPEVKHKKTIPLREMKSVTPHPSSSDPDEDAGAGSRIARVPTSESGKVSAAPPVVKKQLLAPAS